MPPMPQRARFLELIAFFVRAEQSVWIASLAAAAAYTVISTDFGRYPGVAALAVIITVAAAFAVRMDRGRTSGRRTLVRGRSVSPRRVVAYVTTNVLLTIVLKFVIGFVMLAVRRLK